MTSSSVLMDRLMTAQGSNDVTPIDGSPSPALVARALRSGKCPGDRVFDRFLPEELRVVSQQYWTPLAVAVRAAEWLNQLDVQTVVDIGAGAGKFCVAAALAGRAQFTGLEHRERLVSAARGLADVFEVSERVFFLRATFGECSVPQADAYYMFNPFAENIFAIEERLDAAVELGPARYVRD